MELTLKHIEFLKEEIPVSKKLNIDGRLFTLEIQYNEIGDFYTALVYDDSDTLLLTTKLVYMGNVFNARVPGLPDRKLVPLNIPDLASEQPEDLRVSAETFGDRIKLYLI